MKSDEEQSSPPCVCTHPLPSAWSVAQQESRPVQTSDRMTLTPSSFTAIKLGGGGQSEDEGAGWIEGGGQA